MLAALAATSALVAMGPYLDWVQGHNTLLYEAVEVGRRPTYPPGHFLGGVMLAGLLVMSLAILGLCVTRLFTTGPSNPWSRALQTLVVLATSGAITLGVLSPVYALGPILLAAASVAPLAIRKFLGARARASHL